jgi:diguanylate cyclase (GGDEF)-like protein
MQDCVVTLDCSESESPLILIVDDDQSARLHLRQRFEGIRYRVAEASNGEDCLRAVTRLQPALILLDALLPGMDGFECCAQLQDLIGSTHTPILIVTALDDEDSVNRAFAVGATDYVTKPIHWPILRQRVHRLLQQSRLNRQLEGHNQQLTRLVSLDSLTQIANRRHFDTHLERMWRQMLREQSWLSVALCDVDCFKRYNDTYGHLAGDRCLQQVAAALNGLSRRPLDLVARYGGEEFGIILPATPLPGALHLAQQMRSGIKALKIEHRNSDIHGYVTVSFGVASVLPSLGLSTRQLLEVADKALYQAKQEGRDRVVRQLTPLC